jgi:sec-independent protein translocase protein TatC
VDDREMPLTEHLEELRHRLFVIAGSVLVAFVGAYFVARPVLRWMLAVVGARHVVAVGVTETFFAILEVAFILALIAASPVILYQLAAFVLPGLTAAERRVVSVVLLPGLGLFAAGAAGGFFIVVPTVLRIMLSFTGNGITALFTISSVLQFILTLTLPFGLVAEMPLVAGALANAGILAPGWFERQRRYAIVIAAGIAAILAPPDALSMRIMAVPIYAIYEVSALVVRFAYRRRVTAYESVPGTREEH